VILNSRNKDIINFLYHPIISVEDNNEKEFIEFNHTFKEKNFDNFYKGISPNDSKQYQIKKRKEFNFNIATKIIEAK